MLACFLIICQVVVVNIVQKKKPWTVFYLMTFWIMKINSKRVQVQSALTTCTKWQGRYNCNSPSGNSH